MNGSHGEPGGPGSRDLSTGAFGALARTLIRCAARGAPGNLAARLEEEWLADLAEHRRPLVRLRHAFGCCWATAVIAIENRAAARVAARVAVTTSDGLERTLLHRWPSINSPSSRRTAVLATILALHAALIFALANGLGGRFTRSLPAVLTGTVISEPRRAPPPPPPIPTLHPSRIDVPVPTTRFDLDDDGDVAVAPTPPAPPLPPAASSMPTAPAAVERVSGGPGSGFPNTLDFYPPALIRAGIQGLAGVSVCIDARGRLTGAPKTVSSAGDELLDRAALRLAAAGSGHYRPTTENGRAVASCFAFRVRFVLR